MSEKIEIISTDCPASFNSTTEERAEEMISIAL
jgi:hypothetical protein